jgi:polyferredoxin
LIASVNPEYADTAETAIYLYWVLVYIWLMGIITLTVLPFLGSRIWCRYWCPLGIIMEWFSSWGKRFHISPNSKCLGCMECTRNCQMGIDVMKFAKEVDPITNKNSSCIGCGICITVCPVDVLVFGSPIEAEAVHPARKSD